jgi:hypothetical protein
MRAVCFLWFGLGNLFKSSRQIGGFLYETTTCQADQSFSVFPLVLLVFVGGRKSNGLGQFPTSVIPVVPLLRCLGYQNL